MHEYTKSIVRNANLTNSDRVLCSLNPILSIPLKIYNFDTKNITGISGHMTPIKIFDIFKEFLIGRPFVNQ